MDKDEAANRSGLDRRRFLQLVGVVGAGAVAAPLVPALMKRVQGQGGPNAGAGDGRTRQWVMVFDLRYCDGHANQDGAPQCVEACNREHFVPPGQEWIKVFQVEGVDGHPSFLPRPCMHCEDAPCVKVCPVGATYRDKEGLILINHNRCIGCRMCMAACPYGVRQFNWEQPPNPPGAALAKYSPHYPVPHRKGTVEKCMFCAHRLQDGKLPACVDACPKYAIYFGDLTEDIATNGKEVVKLSRFLADNNAYRLKEDLGTHPRVWYIPGHGELVGHTVDQPVAAGKTPRTWLQQEVDKAEKDKAKGGTK